MDKEKVASCRWCGRRLEGSRAMTTCERCAHTEAEVYFESRGLKKELEELRELRRRAKK